jgi:hypothetical protein
MAGIMTDREFAKLLYDTSAGCTQRSAIAEYRKLLRVVNAASFVLDYERDIGDCAVCNGCIGKSDEPDEMDRICQDDCPGRALRDAIHALDKD